VSPPPLIPVTVALAPLDGASDEMNASRSSLLAVVKKLGLVIVELGLEVSFETFISVLRA